MSRWRMVALLNAISYRRPVSQTTYELRNPNLVVIFLTSNDQISSQFCTCHDSWAVVTCANLWPDQIIKIKIETKRITNFQQDRGWGAVSDLSLISDLSQKFKHDLWRVKSKLKLSQKQHLTPDLINLSEMNFRVFTSHGMSFPWFEPKAAKVFRLICDYECAI